MVTLRYFGFAGFGTQSTLTHLMFRKKKHSQGDSPGANDKTPKPSARKKLSKQADSHVSTSASITASPQTIDQELSDLYRANAGPLFRYALLMVRDAGLAQDAVHETFLKYYVQRLRGEVPEERAWLFRVLRNYVLDQQKSAGSKKSVGLEEAHGFEDRSQSPYKSFESSETMRLVMQLLTPRELQCLQLRAEGFSYKEIAEILAIGQGTVGALLARGSGKIRKTFAEDGLPCEAT